MTQDLSAAQQAQMDNRDSTGQFKTKTHADVEDPAEALGVAVERTSEGQQDHPARPSRGIIDGLPYQVPDLSEHQQKLTGLPADFTDAFDEHFTGATEALRRHQGDLDAVVTDQDQARLASLKALERSYPQASGAIGLHAP